MKKTCQESLSEKIRQNTREFNQGKKFVSRKQAIAVAYQQVSKKRSGCNRYFKSTRGKRRKKSRKKGRKCKYGRSRSTKKCKRKPSKKKSRKCKYGRSRSTKKCKRKPSRKKSRKCKYGRKSKKRSRRRY